MIVQGFSDSPYPGPKFVIPIHNCLILLMKALLDLRALPTTLPSSETKTLEQRTKAMLESGIVYRTHKDQVEPLVGLSIMLYTGHELMMIPETSL